MRGQHGSGAPERLRIVYGVTAPVTARTFLTGQLDSLVGRGHQVHLVCGRGEDSGPDETQPNAISHQIKLYRSPRTFSDATALVQLVRLLRRLKPDVVVMGTPKMGLIGTLAAWLCGTPRRIYVLHGLRLEGVTGTRRHLLRLLERLTCTAATEVLAVSPSLATQASREGLVPPKSTRVLGSGTVGGIDTDRFRPAGTTERAAFRRRFGIPGDAFVVVFVGRLTADKGLSYLIDVWSALLPKVPQSWLLLAGASDEPDRQDHQLITRLQALPQVISAGYLPDVEAAYQASDVFLLGSVREGFPTAPLEAAASGLPVVLRRATGSVDAVWPGESGYLVPAESTVLAVNRLVELHQSPALRAKLGARGRTMVLRHFQRDDVCRAWVEHLEDSSSRPSAAERAHLEQSDCTLGAQRGVTDPPMGRPSRGCRGQRA